MAGGEGLNGMSGPPTFPRFQWLGEIPFIIPDVPINSIFLILFLTVGGAHGYLYLRNRSQERTFIINALLTVFCFTRVIATSLRIAWACSLRTTSLGIAATVFLYVGIVILYASNMTFAQRLLRAQHPHFGWLTSINIAFHIVSVITAAILLMLIGTVIADQFTRTRTSINTTLQLQQAGATVLAIVATLPLLITGASTLARRIRSIKMTKTIDKFGAGSMHGKVIVIILSSLLLSVSAWFRAGALLAEPSPINAPQPGYLSKAAFYVLILTFEIAIPILWLFTRVDLRFYIPDGAKGPFSYAGGFVFAGEAGNEKNRISLAKSSQSAQETSQEQPSSTGDNNHPETSPEEEDRITPLSKRSSWAGSIISQTSRDRKMEKQAQLERRISWGGVSREDVRDATDETGKVLRYSAFADSWVGGDTAADVGIEGPGKEMGFDPESGRWAVRPISGARGASLSGTRPASLSGARPTSLSRTRPKSLSGTRPTSLSGTRPTSLSGARPRSLSGARPRTISGTSPTSISATSPISNLGKRPTSLTPDVK